MFPKPTPLAPPNRGGAIVPDGRGDFELSDVMDGDPGGPDDVDAAGPSTARATGFHVDLEEQRQGRWTLGSGGEMG